MATITALPIKADFAAIANSGKAAARGKPKTGGKRKADKPSPPLVAVADATLTPCWDLLSARR
jgi:hypothetical protein